ncbi:hypothetical protein D3C71_1958410 [compost metagenome]
MHMVQAACTDLLAHFGVGLIVCQCMSGMALQLLFTQVHGLALWQIGAKHQARRGTEQRQHRAQLRDHRDRTHRRFDAHHRRTLITPHRQKAGFVQVVA